jgi:hypothetical protein
MRFTTLCPMSDKRVNKWVARVNAALTFLLLLLFFYTQNMFIMLFLALDFLLRGNDYAQYSPLAIASRQILKVLPLKPQSINAGPKFFAARIGYYFSFMIFIFWAFHWNITALVVAGIFALFAFLEAAFGFCMACYVYPFVYKATYHQEFHD